MSRKIIARITFTDQNQGVIFGDDKISGHNLKEVKSKLDAAGYPTRGSPVFIDSKKGKPIRIGWSKDSRDKYEDTGKTFTKETWVSLYEERPLNLDREAKKKKKLGSMS